MMELHVRTTVAAQRSIANSRLTIQAAMTGLPVRMMLATL